MEEAFGPSGSGKTTILRALAGLEHSTECIIRFGDETWVDDQNGVFIPPQLRRIGFVFQDYALFSHLTVAGNIQYGLRRLSSNEQRLRTTELLQRFQLHGLAERYPHQLSGGQKQRVALARTTTTLTVDGRRKTSSTAPCCVIRPLFTIATWSPSARASPRS